MPNIPQYQSHEDLSGPQLAGANSAGEIAGGVYEGLASGLHSVGEAVQRHGEQQESSKFASDHSALTAVAMNAWEDIKQNQDASDPAVRQKFLEDYGQKVDALTDNITSSAVRAHAEDAIARTKAHFAVTTLSDQSAAAGAQAVQRINDVKNNGAATAYIDPTYYDGAGNVTSMYVAASGLPQKEVPKATVQINKEIAKSTVDGMLDRGDTVNARKDIENGRFDKDLDGTEKAALLRHVTEVEREIKVAANASREEADRQAKRASDEATGQYLGQMYEPDYNPTKLLYAATHDDNLSKADKAEIVRIVEGKESSDRANANASRADAIRSADVATSVIQGIYAPVGSPNRITDKSQILAQISPVYPASAAARDIAKLQQRDASEKRADGDAKAEAEFYNTARNMITKIGNVAIPGREEAYHSWYLSAQALDQKMKAAGATPQERYKVDGDLFKGVKALQGQSAGQINYDGSKFDFKTLDTIPQGEAGSIRGINALHDAVTKGLIDGPTATAQAKSRNWKAPIGPAGAR